MLDALFKFIFFILNLIISLVLRLVLLVFPALGLDSLFNGLTGFFNILGNAFNFTVFMLGDSAFVFAPLIITLFSLKHIALPIVNFTRKFFVH